MIVFLNFPVVQCLVPTLQSGKLNLYLCVCVRKHVQDKYDPVVEETDLLNANPNYAVVRSPKGCVVTVSARDIAPTPAGPGEANESKNLSQVTKFRFLR